MSRCDEYRQKMLDTEAEISKLENTWPSVWDDDQQIQNRNRKIKALKQEATSWKDKWERSLKHGGC